MDPVIGIKKSELDALKKAVDTFIGLPAYFDFTYLNNAGHGEVINHFKYVSRMIDKGVKEFKNAPGLSGSASSESKPSE